MREGIRADSVELVRHIGSHFYQFFFLQIMVLSIKNLVTLPFRAFVPEFVIVNEEITRRAIKSHND